MGNRYRLSCADIMCRSGCSRRYQANFQSCSGCCAFYGSSLCCSGIDHPDHQHHSCSGCHRNHREICFYRQCFGRRRYGYYDHGYAERYPARYLLQRIRSRKRTYRCCRRSDKRACPSGSCLYDRYIYRYNRYLLHDRSFYRYYRNMEYRP